MKIETEVRPTPSGRMQAAGPSEGRHRVLAELGQGGMAHVYLAVARGPSGFNKLVVLKALRPNLANDEEFLNMFLHEARLAARLNHPNLVQTYEVGQDEGRSVIVMEYLDGETLAAIQIRARKESRPFPLPMQLRILSDALAGLHHAHELTDYDGRKLTLVHRDMSPQNVFVTFDGQVKVLDFGIAKAASGGVQTSTGVMKGKVRYMAPEQMAGDAVDRRADIYAVGAMLWEAATGTRLWAGLPDYAVMQKVLAGSIAPPRSVAPDVPEAIERICLKATALDRDARYATARDMEKDLDEAIATLGGNVKPRALGDLVAELFADTREQRRSVIESQLAKVASLSSGQFAAVTAVSLRPPGMGEGEGSPTEQVSPAPPARRRPVALFAVLLLGLAAAVAVLVVMMRRAPDTAAAAPSQPQLATPSPAPTDQVAAASAAASAAVASAVAMASAASTPPAASAPSSAATAQAKVTPVPAWRGGPVRVQAREPAASPASTPTPAAAAPQKPSCAQPYYVDSAGIKRIRPDCM